MIQTSFFPQPEKEEPIKIIQIEPSGLQPKKVEELLPDHDILLDTYMIYPTGGYHPFYGVPNTLPRYQLPIWPYVKRIKFDERFKGNKKTLYNVRKSSWDTNHLSSQINPFIRADYFSVSFTKSTRTTRNDYTTILKNGKHKICSRNKIHNEQMHRLVAKAFIPNPENHPLVLHINDDSTNYLIENLKWGTQGDNMKERKLFRVPDGMKKRYLNLVNKGIIKG